MITGWNRNCWIWSTIWSTMIMI